MAAVSRRTKVFFSNTLEAALAQARRELGPDALLVNAGPVPAVEGRAEGYRVVCEVEDPPPRNEPEAPLSTWKPAAATGGPDVSRRLARLERLLEAVAGGVSGLELFPGAAGLQAELAAWDFPPELAHSLLLACRARSAAADTGPDSATRLRGLLLQELSARITFTGTLDGTRRPAVVALVGPPGAGKTSALVKLAMTEGLARRRPVAIVTTDSHRVAAAEQLRTYAAILGLPFSQAETAAMLRQAVAEHASRDLILVDTPGFSRAEGDWADEWARLLAAIPGLQTQLVLPATWRARDVLSGVEWWQRFRPCAMLFTRVDETNSFGGWAAAAIESGLPISYFSTGQRIPEDLEPASLARVESLLAPESVRTAAAGGKS